MINKIIRKPRPKLIFLSLALLMCIGFLGNNIKAGAASKTKLKEKNSTIFINEKYTIPLTGKIKKATYTFTSNKTKIAKVNSKGVITGINDGTASIKIRYKYDGEFHSVGTFKITVHKSSLKTSYKSFDMLTGDTLAPSSYLDDINPDASYIITSSLSSVAKGGSDGIINATKAGRTAITIHEVFNNRSRTVGSIAISVTGASLKKDEIKMAYSSYISRENLLDDMTTGSTYTFTPDKTSLIYTSGNNLRSSGGHGNQICEVTVNETLSTKVKHTIGKFKINLTDETFISFFNQDISIGFGEVITVGNSGIVINNKLAGAVYRLKPADATVLKADDTRKNSSTTLEGINYGTTAVTVEEVKGNTTKTLEDKVNVSVNQAYIIEELVENGMELSINGDTYNRYPFECRNLKAIYDYSSANSSICSVGSGGINKNEDYLVATAKKVGTTEITVYETVTTTTTVNSSATSKPKATGTPTPVTKSSRKKIGTFTVTVYDSNHTTNNPGHTSSPGTTGTPAPGTTSKPGTTGTPAPGTTNTPPPGGSTNVDISDYLDDPVASKLISSIKFTHKGKDYYGYVSDMSVECVFGDEDYGNYIDYGTDFDSITEDEFTVRLANPDYSYLGMESYGQEWAMKIGLNDEDNTVEEVPIYLNTGELDTKSILSSVTVKLGSKSFNINSGTTMLYDDETHQFDDGNTSFEAYFTAKQFCSAGAHDYDEYDEDLYNSILDADGNIKDGHEDQLYDLPEGKVTCTVKGSGGNTAVTNITTPETSDNQYWTFDVEFEDGTTEEFSVSLELDDSGY